MFQYQEHNPTACAQIIGILDRVSPLLINSYLFRNFKLAKVTMQSSFSLSTPSCVLAFHYAGINETSNIMLC